MIRVGQAAPILALALGLLMPAPAEAQASRFLNGLGYSVVGATTGVALGAAAGTGNSCDDFICIPGAVVAGFFVGGAGGAILGGRMANSANQKVARGERVEPGQLTGIVFGTLIGGATLGAITSALLINGDGEGTPLGTDERTFGLFTVAGATLAVLQLRRNWSALRGTEVEVRPAVFDGQPGVSTRIRF